jgi:hypothetical protein
MGTVGGHAKEIIRGISLSEDMGTSEYCSTAELASAFNRLTLHQIVIRNRRLDLM